MRWARWITKGLLIATVAGLPVVASADPIILPTAIVADHAGSFEMVPPDNAEMCRVRFGGAGGSFGFYSLPVGSGPSMMIRWRVARQTRGTWTAALSCGASKADASSLGFTRQRIVAGHRGHPHGDFVRRGTLTLGPGLIPAQAPEPIALLRADFGPRAFVDDGCSSSPWIEHVYLAGTGVATDIKAAPTTLARIAARSTPGAFAAMWGDVQRCVHGLPSIGGDEYESMFKQLVCHAEFGFADTKYTGGPTWDLEGWRNNVGWSTALDPRNGCGNYWGDASNAGAAFNGHIVQSDADTSAQKAAFLVEQLGPTFGRRHILTAKAYFCLKDAGAPGPDLLPQSFLDEYINQVPPDIGDEICPRPVSAPPPSQPSPSSGSVGPVGSTGDTPPPPRTWREQETPNHPVNTFTNYHNASGMGPAIASGQWVDVSCKVHDGTIQSVNPDGYWYRIASSPWNNAYYSPANTFMNGDPYGGPYTHNTDFSVADC